MSEADRLGPMLLRCQTVVDGALAYVALPVDEALWGPASAAEREDLRGMARRELARLLSQRMPSAEAHDLCADLPVWEEREGRCEVECVGGPADGQRVTLPSTEPPPVLRVPAPEASPLEPLEVLSYAPMTDRHGYQCRGSDGAWRFRYGH
ncbi:hypothetical protein ACWEK2_03890 [Streptomyces albidoflavus]